MPLHPFIDAMLKQLAAAGRPAVSAGTPEEGRAIVAASRAALGSGPEIGSVESLHVPTRAGAIEALLLKPEGPPAGLIVYLHGGGQSGHPIKNRQAQCFQPCGIAGLMPQSRRHGRPQPADVFLFGGRPSRCLFCPCALPPGLGFHSPGPRFCHALLAQFTQYLFFVAVQRLFFQCCF